MAKGSLIIIQPEQLYLKKIMSLLELRHIKKYFASQKAVDDISIVIQPGNIFGLLGPNGAGKTTLLRMITGILLPDEGEIIFNGEPFNALQHIAQIGYMPEERGLYKKMKIGEHALYLAQLKGLNKEEATEKIKFWFERLEMQSWWHRKVEDLSKGMSQKLQFVITVLHEPKLIILDEPFSGLDPVNANLIKDEIFRLAEEGSTIIFSTHRMEQVEEICNHIVLMNMGQKILDGTVPQIKQHYKEHAFRIRLSELPATIENEAFTVINIHHNELIVKIKDGFQSNHVLKFFLEQNASIEAFEEILPSLNDIFIHLVEGTPSVTRSFQTTL